MLAAELFPPRHLNSRVPDHPQPEATAGRNITISGQKRAECEGRPAQWIGLIQSQRAAAVLPEAGVGQKVTAARIWKLARIMPRKIPVSNLREALGSIDLIPEFFIVIIRPYASSGGAKLWDIRRH